jgi:hypothetical protein
MFKDQHSHGNGTRERDCPPQQLQVGEYKCSLPFRVHLPKSYFSL